MTANNKGLEFPFEQGELPLGTRFLLTITNMDTIKTRVFSVKKDESLDKKTPEWVLAIGDIQLDRPEDGVDYVMLRVGSEKEARSFLGSLERLCKDSKDTFRPAAPFDTVDWTTDELNPRIGEIKSGWFLPEMRAVLNNGVHLNVYGLCQAMDSYQRLGNSIQYAIILSEKELNVAEELYVVAKKTMGISKGNDHYDEINTEVLAETRFGNLFCLDSAKNLTRFFIDSTNSWAGVRKNDARDIGR